MKQATIADRTIELPNGFELAYFDRGSASRSGAPAVLLLHGFCGTSAYWADVLPHLPEEVRVVVPDLRGHGSSAAPGDEVYTMEAFAGDLEAMLQSLGIDKVYLFGHSLGGYIAAAFAERYPRRLAALSLVHSTALPDTETAQAGRDKAAAAIRGGGIGPFVDELVPKLFAPGHLTEMPGKVEDVKAAGRMTSVHGAAATALGMKVRKDRNGVLAALEVPVLLVAGEKDGIVPQERTFSFGTERTTRKVLEGAGHMGMVERPRELAAVMDAFIQPI